MMVACCYCELRLKALKSTKITQPTKQKLSQNYFVCNSSWNSKIELSGKGREKTSFAS